MAFRLLIVFAHPDDESMHSGMLARYASNGSQVVLVSATRGEAGEISIPSLATPGSLGEVRTAELVKSCAILGIDPPRFLDYRDSGMDGSAENDDQRCFIQAQPEEATGKIVAAIREIKPHIVITFEPFGWYGHPDHIAASKYTTAAYDVAGNPDAYPETGAPWQPQRLFYAIAPRAGFKAMRDTMQSAGLDISAFDGLDLDSPDPLEDQVTHTLDVCPEIGLKRQAMGSHLTQFGPDHPLRQASDVALAPMLGTEKYIQVRPPLILAPGAERIRDLCFEVSQ